MPTYTPVDYDPFDTKVMGKFDDRVPQGNPSSPVVPTQVSDFAPNLAAVPHLPPQAPPAVQIQHRFPPSDTLFAPTYTPVDYDPFDVAAMRQKQTVLPPAGRKEGLATQLPEKIAKDIVTLPARAGRVAEQYGETGEYDAGPFVETALNTVGIGAPLATTGALGSAGGKIGSGVRRGANENIKNVTTKEGESLHNLIDDEQQIQNWLGSRSYAKNNNSAIQYVRERGDGGISDMLVQRDPIQRWAGVEAWAERKPPIMEMEPASQTMVLRQMQSIEKQLSPGGPYHAEVYKDGRARSFHAMREQLRTKYDELRQAAGLRPMGDGFNSPGWAWHYLGVDGPSKIPVAKDVAELMALANKDPSFSLSNVSRQDVIKTVLDDEGIAAKDVLYGATGLAGGASLSNMVQQPSLQDLAR